MDGTTVNETVPVRFSYMPPTVTSIAVQGGFTTAGGDAIPVIITGSNLFGPVSMVMGGSWAMKMFAGANVTFSSSHNQIVASLSPGCGASLPVVVYIAGQPSGCAGAACNITFPAPTVTSLAAPTGAPYNVTALGTLGGQRVILSGTNLGPATTGSAVGAGQLTLSLSYYDESGQFRYTASCTKAAQGDPHSTAECMTAPGVGRQLSFSVNVCGQSSPFVPLSGARYAPPRLLDVSGPGASRANTEGGQLVQLSVQEVGPVNFYTDIPQAVTLVQYGNPGRMQYNASRCYVSFASTTGSEITCLTSPGACTGFPLGYQIL